MTTTTSEAVRPHNEALQQTKPGITTHGPVFAAERRCCTDLDVIDRRGGHGRRGQSSVPAGILLFQLSFTVGCSTGGHLDSAESAARAWLSLVDAAQYEEAWLEAAPQLRDRDDQASWVRDVSEARSGLAEAAVRTTYDRVFRDRLGDGPVGSFVNLSFRVSGAEGQSFGELVSMVKADDDRWRVYGYRVVGGGSGSG